MVVWWALQIRDKLKLLKLNDAEVWAREERRKQEQGDVNAPWYIKAPFWLLCVILDVCFANRCGPVTPQYGCPQHSTAVAFILCCVGGAQTPAPACTRKSCGHWAALYMSGVLPFDEGWGCTAHIATSSRHPHHNLTGHLALPPPAPSCTPAHPQPHSSKL